MEGSGLAGIRVFGSRVPVVSVCFLRGRNFRYNRCMVNTYGCVDVRTQVRTMVEYSEVVVKGEGT